MGNPWKWFAKELSETIPDVIPTFPTSCRVHHNHVNFHHQNRPDWLQVAQPGLPAELSWPSLFAAMWRTGGPSPGMVKLGETAGENRKKKLIRQRYDSMDSMDSMNTWYPYLFWMRRKWNDPPEWSGVDHLIRSWKWANPLIFKLQMVQMIQSAIAPWKKKTPKVQNQPVLSNNGVPKKNGYYNLFFT